ncbi:putative secreted protein [Wickerhamomyces ciferrii]|uniref:Secreted protein n=1 Tax=Wickerhamomyces ciferrii (strain ATCC 14091 / BCRC 22168 / CBS 111 / JCM 3599 / NBRC 0793 / NRRL Y-1031 F-60-10) TaxID=1206466 RepID=K0KI76_WICCF|nr:uncharacterized protein BN7_4484 [Wickerhamomyces ciferrii]CCH44915.1 putative secreted protein [Wickerhamomyces ciferrii]
MLFLHVILLGGALLRQVYGADMISSTESNECGANVNLNPKNICGREELEALNNCAGEALPKLDKCVPRDPACECCALQSMKRDCYGLCLDNPHGEFFNTMYDACETYTKARGVDPCDLPFKKYDSDTTNLFDFILQSTLKKLNQIVQKFHQLLQG